MASTQSAAVYLLILGSLTVYAVALPLTTYPPIPPSSPASGQPCQTWLKCNNSVLLSKEIETCDNCPGPNVCQVTSTYQNYYESGIYSCVGVHCRRLQCIPIGVCDIIVNSTYTEHECCHGYAAKKHTKDKSDYHKFYYPIPQENKIKKNGCPIELNETICDCLETLKLTSFLSLLQQTGLDELLCGNETTDQQYTVFAPTNEAINKADLSSLSSSELLTIVKAHIIAKQYPSKDLSEVYGKKSLASGHYVHVDNSGPWASPYKVVNGKRLLIEDGCLSLNGVVHVVDGIISCTNKTIAQVLKDTPQFSTFWSLFVKANLADKLNETEAVLKTVFAPDNEAFEKAHLELGIDIAQCLADTDVDALSYILKNHVVYELIYCTKLSQQSFLPSAACYIEPEYYTYRENELGPPSTDLCILDIRGTDEGIAVGVTGSVITKCDVCASNGVIHPISLPLIPSHINLIHLCSQY